MHSFGIGGVNAHVVLEQYTAPANLDDDPGAQVLALSAQSVDALRERASRLIHRLAETDPSSWADIAYTLQVGREAMSCRLAFVARSTDEAARILGGWLTATRTRSPMSRSRTASIPLPTPSTTGSRRSSTTYQNAGLRARPSTGT
ncbi:hypothetical protein SMICM304S_07244 [Streptomyces microflavus]